MERLLADDGMILASTRSGTERAVSEVQSVSKEFGLDSQHTEDQAHGGRK